MRIIKISTLRACWQKHPDAEARLRAWIRIVEDAQWQNILDVRSQLPHADAVATARGNLVTVFNIGGGRYRLIVAIHYRSGCVYIREFLTHGDYSKGDWKTRN